MEQEAFAYVDEGGQIDLMTVAPTELAAKIKSIVEGSCGHVVPGARASDKEVDKMFTNITGGQGGIKKITLKVAG